MSGKRYATELTWVTNKNGADCMAARDRYNINIECNNCGEKGVIGIAEDDYTFMQKSNRAVDFTEGNISAFMKDETYICILCKKCGTEHIWPK